MYCDTWLVYKLYDLSADFCKGKIKRTQLYFTKSPSGTYFIYQSQGPGKLTFVNASSIYLPLLFRLLKHVHHARILREFSRASSELLRAKLWLVRRRYNTFRVERRDDCEYVCVQFYSLGHNFFPTLLFWSNLIHFFFSVNIRLLARWQSFFVLFVVLFFFFILGLFAGYIFFSLGNHPTPPSNVWWISVYLGVWISLQCLEICCFKQIITT